MKSKSLLYAGTAVALGALAWFVFFRHSPTTVPNGPLSGPRPGPNLAAGSVPLAAAGPNQILATSGQAIGVAGLGYSLLKGFGLFGSSDPAPSPAQAAFGSTPQIWTGTPDELGI